MQRLTEGEGPKTQVQDHRAQLAAHHVSVLLLGHALAHLGEQLGVAEKVIMHEFAERAIVVEEVCQAERA